MKKLIILILILVAGYFGRDLWLKRQSESGQKLVEGAVVYINDNLLKGGSKAELKSVVKEAGLYKAHLKIGEAEYDSYVTLDGKFLFPNPPVDLSKKPEVAGEQGAQQKVTCGEISKLGEPLLEVFVVSQCPYGLQMQRILAEVVSKIPSLKDRIKVEYIGAVENNKVTAMHGEKEADENLRQICIREEQSEKYWDYLNCYMKKGETESCLKIAKVDEAKLKTCMTGKGLDYAKADFALAEKYGATGSPTLILNGKTVNESGFAAGENLTMRSAEALKKLLCCGFETAPSECEQEVKKEAAAASFSENYEASAGSSASSSCE